MRGSRTLMNRVVLSLVAVLGLYLVIANGVLRLPAVQDHLNRIQPERFAVTWQRAWSLYPLRVQLIGVAADGQTSTEQWQLDAGRAAATVALLPLLRGEVVIRDLDLADIDLRLRPRPRPGAQADALAEFYPVIRNRDPNALADPEPDEPAGGPVLEIDDIHVRGDHSFWVSHVRGSVPGEVRGSFRVEPSIGRLSLAGGALELALTALAIGPETPVADRASVKGRIDIPPFVLSETKGLALLRVPDVDAEVDLPVQSLRFLALLNPSAAGLGLTGQGRLHGRLVLAKGEALRGTDLAVEARELRMDLGAYDFAGDGVVELVVEPEDESQADLTVRFDKVQAELESAGKQTGDTPLILFTGRGLVAKLHAAEVDPTTTSNAERVAELAAEVTLKASLDIPQVQVPDLKVYNRLFPPAWDLELLGGAGTLRGAFEITGERLSLELDLASDNADMRHRDYRATTDLLVALRARVDDVAGPRLHLDGSEFRLEDAAISASGAGAAAGQDTKPWSASLRVAEGTLRLPTSPDAALSGPIPAAAKVLADQGFGALLTSADGELDAVLTVSGLDWIAALLNRPLGLSLTGGGELDIGLVLAGGLPVAGTTLAVPRQSLGLTLLEHHVEGAGEASVHIEEHAKQLRLRLGVALETARMRRRDETNPGVGDVRMDAVILAPDPRTGQAVDQAEATVKIHSARVPDLAVYNAYLPPGAPVSVHSGAASLVGDLRVAPNKAQGNLLLTADDVRLGVDREELSGKLRVEVLIRDGAAADMRFDVTGSSVVLEGLQVVGATASSTGADWHARLQLAETEVLWHKPMHLRTESEITIKDVAPFLALLDNERGKHSWLEDMLAVKDLAGHLRLHMDGDTLVIEDAMVSGPQIGVHAKGRFDAASREAMVLLRWHNLSGALELDDERKHFDISGAPARFAAYAPGKGPLPFASTAGPVAETAAPARAGTAGALDRGEPPGASHVLPRPLPSDSTPHRPPANPFLDESL